MEAGGYATTLGVRYQALWAVRQLLLLLAEEIRSVRIEPAGSEGEGVDFIVLLRDGSKEYQQCRRANRALGKWTMGALAARGLLASIRDRLGDDRAARFRLVSLDPAPDLRDLTESARASLDAESFFRDQLQASADRFAAFERLCTALGLDHGKPQDLESARDLLQRSEITLVGDDEGDLREIRSRARLLVDGDAGAVVAALESAALEKLRCEITAADVDGLVRARGLHPRRLERDDRIVPALRRLQESFEQSLSGQLVGGRLLPRDETVDLMNLLADPQGPRLIALHGAAGVGKSGVLLEAARRLSAEGVPYIPIRLDRQRPGGSLPSLGESLGLPESPGLCLGSLSAGGKAVLLLDQLDALRWTHADAGQALDACRELVREAMSFPNVRVVACCRSFDLDHDPQIRSWLEQEKARKLAVHQLSEDKVRAIIAGMSVSPAAITARQVSLLRTIQLLRTWEETRAVTGSSVVFATERELLDAFWESRLREAERKEVGATRLQAAVDRIVDHMDRSGSLVAPGRLLREHLTERDLLQSLNVITLAEDRIAFCHQTYLDHQLAHLLVRRLDHGEITVEDWITSGHQGLYRREQLRLVLQLLRQDDLERFLDVIRGLLRADGVRFHLKQLVLEVLGQIEDIKPGEVAIVLTLLGEESWREHGVADVLFGHPAWFLAAKEAGLLASWLEGGHAIESNYALSLIRTVIDKEGERCCELLAPLVERGDGWPERVAGVLPLAPAKDSPSIFGLRIRLTELGVHWHYIDWSTLGGSDPERLVRFLTALLASLDPEEDNRQAEQNRVLAGLSKASVAEVSTEALMVAWRALLPRCSQLIGRAGDEVTFRVVEDRGWRSHLREFMRKLAAELVARDARTMIQSELQGTHLAEILVLETLKLVDDAAVADLALAWLTAEPHRLRLRWSGSDLPWEVSRQAVERLTRVSSPTACATFERFLLDFREPRFRESMEYRHDILLKAAGRFPRFSEWALEYPSDAGSTAYHLLACLPAGSLSERSRRELTALTRKFSKVDEVFFAGWGKGQGGIVVSPLPHDRLNSLSDKSWLRIIGENSTDTGSGWRGGRYRNGQFEKSSPATFAGDLKAATVREPGRFARLALRFPPDANPLYFGAVLQGLGRDAQKERQGEDATLREIEEVLVLPQVSAEPSLAEAVAWLMGDRADSEWGLESFNLLADIATRHPDPRPGELRLGVGAGGEEWSPTSLSENALNCTRGAAVYAIARLLFADPGRLETFRPFMTRIVADSHPAVRVAAFRCCLAVLESRPEEAIAWALQAADGHEPLLATHGFEDFLFYACHRRPVALEATIRRMLESSRADVVRVAARHAMSLYLAQGLMEEEARACISGPPPKRVGAAEVAAAFAGSSEPSAGTARSVLLELVGDEEDEVLGACGEAFREGSLDRFSAAVDFMETYASSRAFMHHPFLLLHRLREHGGSLVPFVGCILSACRNLAGPSASGDPSLRPAFSESGYYLPGILLRLYEQAEEERVRDLCLDAWDLLLRARVVEAVELTRRSLAEA